MPLDSTAALSDTAVGPAVAHFQNLTAAFAYAGEVRARRRIVIETSAFAAFGWVPTAAITDGGIATDGATQSTIGGLGARDSKRPAERHRACDRDVDLSAEVAGERATVGTLKAGTNFRIAGDAGEGFEAITVEDASISLSEDAKLVARAKDLEACPEAALGTGGNEGKRPGTH
jgi:hypothetical protein